MTMVRHVSRLSDTPKTERPVVNASVDHDTRVARLTTVVSLFPKDDGQPALVEAPAQVNIFADLKDPPRHDLRVDRARGRMARFMHTTDIPEIENLFDEDCADVDDAVLNAQLARFHRKHRPLENARDEILAMHDDIAHSHSLVHRLSHPLNGLAAGIGTLGAAVMLGQLPNF